MEQFILIELINGEKGLCIPIDNIAYVDEKEGRTRLIPKNIGKDDVRSFFCKGSPEEIYKQIIHTQRNYLRTDKLKRINKDEN